MQANQLQTTCQAQALDWTAPLTDAPCQPDLILASDLLYERAAVPALFATIKALSQPSTLTLLAVEVRPAIHDYAMGQLQTSGLHVRQVTTPAKGRVIAPQGLKALTCRYQQAKCMRNGRVLTFSSTS